MLDWSIIREPLRHLIADVSGQQTVWIDKRRPFVNPVQQTIVLLKIRGVGDIGVDDRRYTDTGAAAPDNNLQETTCGTRRVRFEIRVESFDHSDDTFAHTTAERIRTAFSFRSVQDTLRELNMSIASRGEALDVSDVQQDQHVVSVAILELVLNAAFGVTFNDLLANVPGTTPSTTIDDNSIETVEDPVFVP